MTSAAKRSVVVVASVLLGMAAGAELGSRLWQDTVGTAELFLFRVVGAAVGFVPSLLLVTRGRPPGAAAKALIVLASLPLGVGAGLLLGWLLLLKAEGFSGNSDTGYSQGLGLVLLALIGGAVGLVLGLLFAAKTKTKSKSDLQ